LRYLDIEGEQRGEYYALVLFATVGMMFLACGYDLISLYISLELMALTFYVLVGFTKRDRRSNEAGMKYFLLGAFSSGVLLYGMSLLFGVAGSTNLGDISQSVAASLGGATPAGSLIGVLPLRPMLVLGMIALAAGLFFKIAAVPFHMWAPDAYEGAPTSVTAFLSTGSKAASFALLARIFLEALGAMRADWAPLLGLVAAITIMVGNWAAVTQVNAKRLLAYSSISNAGYLLLGVIAANEYGYIGLVVYLLVYTLMNIGAFGVIISLRRRGLVGDNVDDLRGLGEKAPGMALMMTIFMLSLGGLPLTGGFIGKWFLFGGLLQRAAADGKDWYIWLAVWAILNTVISFFYYVRFIRVMYLGDGVADARPLSVARAQRRARRRSRRRHRDRRLSTALHQSGADARLDAHGRCQRRVRLEVNRRLRCDGCRRQVSLYVCGRRCSRESIAFVFYGHLLLLRCAAAHAGARLAPRRRALPALLPP
jgi:NADH-quinone oxidoreductase subunit N